MDVQTVINRALRRIGVVGSGATPSDVETQDALDTLKSLYQRWISEGAFGALTNVVPSGDYVARENERIYRNNDAVTSITLPDTVAITASRAVIDDYGDSVFTSPILSINGNCPTRLPRDGSVVVIIDSSTSTTVTYIYDGHVKSWCDVSNMFLTDKAPLSERDASGLTACLAVELADEFGQTPAPLTVNSAQRFQSGLAFNYSQAGDVITPVSFI